MRCWVARSVLAHSVCLVACVVAAPSDGIGFAACAGKHYFVIGTKAAGAPTLSLPQN